MHTTVPSQVAGNYQAGKQNDEQTQHQARHLSTSDRGAAAAGQRAPALNLGRALCAINLEHGAEAVFAVVVDGDRAHTCSLAHAVSESPSEAGYSIAR